MPTFDHDPDEAQQNTMLVMLRHGIQGVAASPRFTVISEVAEACGLGPSKLTPKKAARLMCISACRI